MAWKKHSKRVPLVEQTNVTHSDLLQAVCKISSYLTVGKPEDAKAWADKLREYLDQLRL